MKTFILLVLLGSLLVPIAELRAQNDVPGEAADRADAAAPAAAAPDDSDIWTRKQLTGDWWGVRSGLAEKGVTLDLRLAQYYQNVVSGGKDTGGKYGGIMDYVLNVDGHKLGLWEGIFLQVHTISQFGQSIISQVSPFSFPNTQMLYPLPDYRGTAVTSVQFTQFLSPNLALFGGKLNTIDFWNVLYPDLVGGGYTGFMNTNLLAAATPWFRWVNLSELAGGFFTVTDEQKIQAGVVVLDTVNSSTTFALNRPFSNGAGILGWYKFFLEMDGKPGSVLLVGGGSTGEYNSFDPTSWGQIPGLPSLTDTKTGAWSMAMYYEQVLWQVPGDTKRDVVMWAGGSVSDGDPSFGQFAAFARLESRGALFDHREGDRAGIGVFYSQLSSDFKDSAGSFGVNLQDLWGVEAYYNYEFTPWFHLTGDLQVLEGAKEEDDVAVVLGVRAVLDF